MAIQGIVKMVAIKLAQYHTLFSFSYLYKQLK